MKLLKIGVLVLGLGLAGLSAIAKEKSYKFDLDLGGIVGAKNLRSSTYRVVVKCGEDGKGTVSFYDGSRLAAQVPCNIVATDTAADFYSVSYGADANGKRFVSTIFLKGEKQKVVLNSGN